MRVSRVYSLLKGLLLSWLRTPEEPPDPPRGDPASVETFRASPKFLRYQLLLFAIRQIPGALISLVIAIGMFAGAEENHQDALWMRPLGVLIFLSAIFGTLLRYWMIRLDYDLRYYILTDRSLRIRQGAWRINEATFTFANIQNLSLHQGPLERMLGISNLIIETAGGGGGGAQRGQPGAAMMHNGVLRGIENAEQMRDRMLTLLKKYRDAGLGDEKKQIKKLGSVRSKGLRELGGLPPQTIPLLREVREEARRLVWALQGKQ